MSAKSTVFRHQLILSIVCSLVSAGSAIAFAQEAPRERDPAPARERAEGQPRDGERGANPQGTPDGQPEIQITPGDDPIARPRILPNRWYLGVYAYDTQRGVMLTDVVPGSPAAAVGLEPRDLIVSVGGFQVGYVGDDYYPLGEELQNRANPRGHVRLLVQNRRNNELVNIDVPLERHGSYYRRER